MDKAAKACRMQGLKQQKQFAKAGAVKATPPKVQKKKSAIVKKDNDVADAVAKVRAAAKR